MLIVLFSCSTKKNSFTRRIYHNLTSHYNCYWNGNESYKEGKAELKKIIVDDYNKILPVFNYGTDPNAKTLNPYMDRAIEKASIVIQRHSMHFDGKEYCRWIDDSYMLIGKAYFYKQEYIGARRTFNFVIKEYSENEIKYDAMLWLAQTYNQMGEFEKSEALLNLFQSKDEKEFIKPKFLKKFPLIFANYYILQEKYDPAINYLYRGIELNSNKQLITRLKFMLAQIYHKENHLTQASKLYSQVIKRNPPYEMAFQAKINLAKTYDATSGDSKQINKTLTKMLKDIKNKEYKDQIYYALAEIALKDGNDTLGINYLKLSVSLSSNNDYQKVTSSLKLADIYFIIPEYENAQAYYDTVMQSLPEDFPNYEVIRNKALTLSSLVTNLSVIQLEDSLQYLASLSEEDRNAIVDNIIEKYIKDEEARIEQELLAQQDRGLSGQTDFTQDSRSGAWYFYNPQMLSSGYTEFVKNWGNRKLEDNWRLINKQIISFGFDEQEEIVADSIGVDSAIVVSTNPKDREYYLQNIPFTEEEIKISNDKIIDALFNLGGLYKEGLEDDKKSIESFEELLNRFPQNKYQLKAYYSLYKLYAEEGDQEKLDFYKNLIINKYPESDYAKVIQDPDYYKTMYAQHDLAAALYKNTYEAFTNEQYYMVINYSDNAISTYSDTALMPKFEFLRALSIGKIEVVDSLQTALNQLIKKYPESEVKPLAQDILDHLSGESSVSGEDGSEVSDEDADFISPYIYDPNAIFFYMLIVKEKSVNLNALKVKISDFNKKYYRLEKLTINSILLDKNRHMITVGNFGNMEYAMGYFNTISKDEYVFSSLTPIDYKNFVISTENYPVFYKNKDTKQYSKFFEKNYLKK